MTNQLWELDLQYPDAPWVYPGDINDDGWRAHKCPPELLNFIRGCLPKGFAIPGQHDLPHHCYADLRKSGYWSLMHMGVIEDLPAGVPYAVNDKLLLYGFPWGIEVAPTGGHAGAIAVAVIHDCIWMSNYGYDGASSDKAVGNWIDRLKGYDVALFGDNHKGFRIQRTKTTPAILNNGTFMVRHKNDKAYPPKVGLVYDDGTVDQLALDTSEDVYLEDDNEIVAGAQVDYDLDKTMAELEKSLNLGINVGQAIRRKLQDPNVRPQVAELLITILQDEE